MITLGTAARNAACNAETALVNAGGAGSLGIGAANRTPGTFTLASTAFENSGTLSAGVARAKGGDGTNPVSPTNQLTALATGAGTADNYQVKSGAGTVIWSGTVTATGGGGDL